MRSHRSPAPHGRAVSGLAALAILAAATGQAAAQPSFNVTFGRALNALSSSDSATADDRRTTGGALEVEQKLMEGRLRVFYTLDAGDYTTPGDWRYMENAGGATWQIRPTPSSGPSVFAGADVLWRTNGNSWEAADYRAVGMFLNAEWKPRDTRTLRAGYRADVRSFPDMPELDQVEHEGFASALVNLESRTTLIGEVRVGAKQYEVLDLVAAPAGTLAGTDQSGAGWSRGRNMGAVSRGAVLSTPAGSGTVGGTAGQVTALGRVAQSLTDRTGVTLQYSRRESFGALPTAVVTTPALFFDDGVYDDPFGSNAGALRVSVKHVLAGGMTVRGSGVHVQKNYRGTMALDTDGAPLAGGDLRADRIWQAGAAWTMPLFGEWSGPVGLEVLVDYHYTRHRSNDAFYNYSSHAVGFALSVAY